MTATMVLPFAYVLRYATTEVNAQSHQTLSEADQRLFYQYDAVGRYI